MSTSVLFAIGVVVFALTVYGAVMATGLTLTRRFEDENGRYRGRSQVVGVDATESADRSAA